MVDGRSRSAVAAVRALAAGGYRPFVVISRRRSAAALSRACAGVVPLPSPESSAFLDALRAEVSGGRYLTALATSDAALLALGDPGLALVDKSALPALAAAAGLSVPTTTLYPSPRAFLDAAQLQDYPCVVKARVKASPVSAVAQRIDSPAGAEAGLRDMTGPIVVQPFLSGTMRAVAGVMVDGEMRAVVHQEYRRTWPAVCGVASAAVSTAPDVALERRVLQLLRGHAGIFQVQLIGDHLIDVNPRAYGSLPLAVAAGANLPAIACAALEGAGHELVRGRAGVRYRWLEGDLRSVVQEVRAGRVGLAGAARALMPRRHTAHSIESLRDPGPGLSRLRDLARRRR